MLLRTIVAQDFFDALAEAALVNVQVLALSSSFAAVVGAGAGAAMMSAGNARRPRNEGVDSIS